MGLGISAAIWLPIYCPSSLLPAPHSSPPPPATSRQVMGLQRSERLLPCRAARRSLLRAVADPALHDQFMASVYAGHHPSGTPPLPGGGSEEGTASQAPSQAGDLLVASTQLQEGEEGIDEVADDEEEAGGWAVAAEDSESQLLLEASSFGADGWVGGTGWLWRVIGGAVCRQGRWQKLESNVPAAHSGTPSLLTSPAGRNCPSSLPLLSRWAPPTCPQLPSHLAAAATRTATHTLLAPLLPPRKLPPASWLRRWSAQGAAESPPCAPSNDLSA